MAHFNEVFLEKLSYMNKTMKSDISAGHVWKYCNSSGKKASGFEQARKQGKYLVNCVDGVQWAMKMAGCNATSWYGSTGKIAWLNNHAKADVEKHFTIIPVDNMTVKQLYDKKLLCDGDILTYVNMSHTNAYIGHGKSFDSGHAYCTGSGEGAVFKKWIGALSCKSSKVAFILRAKDRAHYRVQCGSFSVRENAEKVKAKLVKLGYGCELKQVGDQTKVQVGHFDGKTNAEAMRDELVSKGIAAIITEE